MAAEVGNNELAEVQLELQSVKKALRLGTDYLGMKAEPLQRYLLQLNEKENLLLSLQFRNMSVEGSSSLLGASASASSPQTNGVAPAAAAAAPEAVKVEPREPPPGPPRVLDRDSLDAVIRHLTEYEGNLAESTRALRALSSLAYADAPAVGDDARVLPQALRVLAIHGEEDGVQLAGMRAFCNMAYAPAIALGRLAAHPGVLAALVAAMARSSGPRETGAKASEAVARIVAAEVNPELQAEAAASGKPIPEEVKNGPGALAGLFLAAMGGDDSWLGVAMQLMLQLISNEVVEPTVVAQRFVASAAGALESAATSVNWLELAKKLSACEVPELPQALVDGGAIAAAAELMKGHTENESVQLAGIEGMSSLVGNRWAGLQAFADVQGMERVEVAMRGHTRDAVLQTKGIRALASGIQWPEDVQQKSAYSPLRSVALTKTAMSAHGSNSELQVAGLEALAKYLDRLRCMEAVKSDGGEGLVKLMMTQHKAVGKIQHWGKIVLDGLGVDRNWKPQNT